MHGADVLLQGLRLVHGFYRDTRDRSDLHAASDFRPTERANSIAWNWWHTARTEDFMVQRICRDRPELWNPARARATGLPESGIGTGPRTADAARVHIRDLDAFFDYQEAVFSAGETFVATLSARDLERTVMLGDRSETVAENLNWHVLVHLSAHLGETDLLRDLFERDHARGARA